MKYQRSVCVWIVLMVVSICCVDARAELSEDLACKIVPMPASLERHEGHFRLKKQTPILYRGTHAKDVAQYLADVLQPATGYALTVAPQASAQKVSGILLELTGADADQRQEAYSLKVNRRSVVVTACAPAGLFYGVQTLRQLLPPDIESPVTVRGQKWTMPCVTIEDQPRYAWRGMMLDVSRHYFPTSFIKSFIDILAMHKLNTFHWHLVDDQGWRIEIKQYPKLTDVGAWRVDREHLHWNSREKQKADEKATYGGFYTQAEIREIVAYARLRHVTVVPEIEMPAHVTSALAAYPELSCTGGPFTVPPGGLWPITDIYCAGNDTVFSFLEAVLAEVIDLFPGTYIHVGGDEATKTEWETCAQCQARIEAQGLKDEHELQSYFIKRMEGFLKTKGRRLIGWDEILEGGLAPEATVMSWRGMHGGIKAAQQGHDVVMSPTSHCYFDYCQGDRDLEPEAFGAFLPLKKVYTFDPTPAELTGDQARHILGGQANLWTEYVPTPEHAQYMIMPRVAALSEAVWSPRAQRDWEAFVPRLIRQLQRYEHAGLNYARSAFQVTIHADSDLKTRQLVVTLESEIPKPELRYTVDGSTPTNRSHLHSEPFTLTESAVLKAGAFLEGTLQGRIMSKPFVIHKATARPVRLRHANSSRYDGGGAFALTNTLRGSTNLRDGCWQGFEGDDLEAVIDLGKTLSVSKLSVGCLQSAGDWVFLPTAVTYALSLGGKQFNPVATVPNELSAKAAKAQVNDFRVNITPTQARFVKVLARNRGVCPPWHAGAGSKAWIFVDEIVVE